MSRYVQHGEKFETVACSSKIHQYKYCPSEEPANRTVPESAAGFGKQSPNGADTFEEDTMEGKRSPEIKTTSPVIFEKCHGILRALVHFLRNTACIVPSVSPLTPG